MSPALAGGFSTTAPPGKPDVNPFLNGVCSPLLDGQDLKQNGAAEWSRGENPSVWIA